MRINFPDDDPRSIVVPIVEATGARVATDRYADYNRTRKMVGAKSRPNTETTDIVMTSNLIYDRFDNYAAPQNPSPQSLAGYYRELNALPHLEVSNGRPTMAYFNPVLRIVAIDGSMERLIQISAAIKAAAPGFKVELIEPKPHN